MVSMAVHLLAVIYFLPSYDIHYISILGDMTSYEAKRGVHYSVYPYVSAGPGGPSAPATIAARDVLLTRYPSPRGVTPPR